MFPVSHTNGFFLGTADVPGRTGGMLKIPFTLALSTREWTIAHVTAPLSVSQNSHFFALKQTIELHFMQDCRRYDLLHDPDTPYHQIVKI